MWEEYGRQARLAAQAVLWEKGDPSTDVIFLVEGELDVVQQSLEGEVAVVRTVRQGELVGEMSALDGALHSATVRARTPCELRRIPTAEFKRALEGNLELVHDLLKRQNERVRWLTRQVAVLGFENVATRIARLIARDMPPTEAPIPITHKDLAERVAATRESVTKALGLLARQGFVTLGRGHIQVVDRPGLEKLAGEEL